MPYVPLHIGNFAGAWYFGRLHPSIIRCRLAAAHAAISKWAHRRQMKGLFMITQARRPLGWVLLAALLAYLMYLTFTAYLSPDFLIGYANLFSC